jgi:hypothetical protein
LDTLRKISSNTATPNNSIGWGMPNMCTIPVGIPTYKNADNSLLDCSVSPNPFNDLISININGANVNLLSVEIMDVVGHLILNQHYKANQNEILIDTSVLKNGIYFLRVNSSFGIQTKKIVKQ